MASTVDVDNMKVQVARAMESLLRAADERISWNQPTPAESSSPPPSSYTFLPGVYCLEQPRPAVHQSDTEGGLDQTTNQSTPTLPSIDTSDSEIRVVLHGDNTFEYVWKMKRNVGRGMEHLVEMTGRWHKPMLNRTRRGHIDQRVFLSAEKIRFQRLSNYDPETGAWKLCLRTLVRHGSDWANVGMTERGIPPIIIALEYVDGALVSTGAVMPSQVLSTSPACRILAGLTKKVANKLGAPIDVMTEKWLPNRGIRLGRVEKPNSLGIHVRPFNPFICMAEALKHASISQKSTQKDVFAV